MARVIVGLFHETIDHKGNPTNDFVGTAASADLVITSTNVSVPGPIVGAGLPGLVATCMTSARPRQVSPSLQRTHGLRLAGPQQLPAASNATVPFQIILLAWAVDTLGLAFSVRSLLAQRGPPSLVAIADGLDGGRRQI
jgi:hypothetical protein